MRPNPLDVKGESGFELNRAAAIPVPFGTGQASPESLSFTTKTSGTEWPAMRSPVL